VSFQNLFSKGFATLSLLLVVFTAFAVAQEDVKKDEPATLVAERFQMELRVATGNNLYCAGYIQRAKVNTEFEIIGADDEKDGFIYSQNNFVYISRGASQGVKVGDMFSVIRPRGKFETSLSKKKGLGFYVQEVGAIEVVNVKNNVSVARVTTSCDNLLLGDLLEPVPQRTSPVFESRPALDIFADPTGKATGRIVLARDGQELLSRENIVYIDLGNEDNVKVGDFLTIYRPLGTGNVVDTDDIPNETLSARSGGYQSKEYQGGKYSNQAPRKAGSEAGGGIVTTADAKKGRPNNLRKIVGEMMIVNVKERTATAVITRTASEIHTGDNVELQ
jgi:hypothetical protein